MNISNIRRQVEQLCEDTRITSSPPEGFPFLEPSGSHYWTSEEYYKECDKMSHSWASLCSPLSSDDRRKAFRKTIVFRKKYSRPNPNHPWHKKQRPDGTFELPDSILRLIDRCRHES